MWWNQQTHDTQNVAPKGVQVQVLSWVPNTKCAKVVHSMVEIVTHRNGLPDHTNLLDRWVTPVHSFSGYVTGTYYARVVESADAADLKSADESQLQVQVLSRVPNGCCGSWVIQDNAVIQ
jgi:hypothetical protein